MAIKQTAQELINELNNNKNPMQAKVLSKFFKTGAGEYGEGDNFLGIKVPLQRTICENYYLELNEIQKLLNGKIHEYRLCGLFLLIKNYETSKKETNLTKTKEIFYFYLKNVKLNNINNWDLVDTSAPNIIGDYLLNKKDERTILYNLAKSNNLWERRVSILATFTFIKNKETLDTIRISKLLLNDKHDLIHKAVGWMLREMGKRASEKELIKFLKENSKRMPRTMLRYSIERLSKTERTYFLEK